MWQFITGFGFGIYIGTYYDCKPALEFVRKTIKENMPEKKADDDQSNDSK